MEVNPGDDDFVRSAKNRKPDGKLQEHSMVLSITHSRQAVNPPVETSVSDVLAPFHPKRSTRRMCKKE